ncbi:RTA1-domain-containing protein [Polyplosphaeria fusca]|uniref:RTA1-domain-containing protein n=1 Tax=Polyplosphaeria fusca TaxID=682080 RepID=A0A9P4QKQ8_9PLEO|nr:RTA1-domain-containing protein [Polyplosphaeria fusca]
MSTYQSCTQVSAECPVNATTYGYIPSLAGNLTLLIVFAVCTIAHVVLGFRFRIIAFSAVVSIGCLGEALGYIGRLMMHNNPWSATAFKIQVICLVLSPACLAAGIYLTLKHIVLALGPEMSRLKPHLYTWIFIGCDVVSILIQAAGGAIAAGGDDSSRSKAGNNLMIAGIAFQVATMAFCLVLATDFSIALSRSKTLSSRSAQRPIALSNSLRGLYYYLTCSFAAFLAIFVRSIYRLPEMAGGWGGPLMRVEVEFLILDGGMIGLAVVLMAVAHPGIFFPAMRNGAHFSHKEDSTPYENMEMGPMNRHDESAHDS